jgi:hypothetical protein
LEKQRKNLARSRMDNTADLRRNFVETKEKRNQGLNSM